MKNFFMAMLVVSISLSMTISRPIFAATDSKAADTSSAATSSEPKRPDYATKVLEYMNAARKEAKLPPLVADTALDAVALLRAEECKTICDAKHTRPNGTSYVTAFDEAKIPYVYWGEMTFSGSGTVCNTAKKAVDGWLDSPGHKAIIMSTTLTTVGIGRYIEDEKYYWAVDFTGSK